MSIEEPAHPETRPTAPAWPTSQVSATPAWPSSQSSAPVSPHSVVTPARSDALATDSYDEEGDEEFEQFDWDSWQPPGDVSDDGPKAEEVDWDLGPGMAASAADFPDDGTDSWPDWDSLGESEDGIISAPFDPVEATAAVAADRATPAPRVSVLATTYGTPAEEEAELPTTLGEPLRASGKAWPPAKQISPDVVHVRVPRWAPFATGLALAMAMVLASAAVVSQTGRLGLTLAVLTGQVPTSADAVVNAYLSAISRGDATKARTYLSNDPQTDTLLLTDKVLKRSVERSAVTVLRVAPAASSLDGTERVAATYTIGSQQVTTTFTTGFSEGQWWIKDDPGRIGLGSIRVSGIPLFINGEEIPSNIDSLPAFPGTYELSTANPYIAFAAPSTIVVRSPDEAPVIGAVRLELTEAGRQRAYGATRVAVAACLAKQELQPVGCPQNIEPTRNEPPVAGSITYTMVSETPMSVAETDLRSATATVKYVAAWRLDVKVYVNGTPRDVYMGFDVITLWQVKLSDTTPTAALVR